MAHMIVKTEKSRLKESGFILLDLQHIGWGPPTWGGGRSALLSVRIQMFLSWTPS